MAITPSGMSACGEAGRAHEAERNRAGRSDAGRRADDRSRRQAGGRARAGSISKRCCTPRSTARGPMSARSSTPIRPTRPRSARPRPSCELLNHDAVFFRDGLAYFDDTAELIVIAGTGRGGGGGAGRQTRGDDARARRADDRQTVPWAVYAALTLERVIRIQAIARSLGNLQPDDGGDGGNGSIPTNIATSSCGGLLALSGASGPAGRAAAGMPDGRAERERPRCSRRSRSTGPRRSRSRRALAAQLGDEAAVYAGGTELLVVDERAADPLPASDRHQDDPGARWHDPARRRMDRSVIGALATHRRDRRSPLVRAAIRRIWRRSERNVANVRVRDAGTLGGNLCFAEPHSDPATLLDRPGRAASPSSRPRGRGEVARGGRFSPGCWKPTRRPDEMLTEIRIPALAHGSGVAYERFKTHERPSATVAAVVGWTTRSISDAGSWSAASRPAGADAAAEDAAGRKRRCRPVRRRRRPGVRADVEPTRTSSNRPTYKRQLAATLVRRAIAAAVARAGGDGDDGRRGA